MKKRILFGVVAMAAAAIVIVSAVNVNSNESDLLSQNLEALTRVEKSDPIWDIIRLHSGDVDCQTGGDYACPSR